MKATTERKIYVGALVLGISLLGCLLTARCEEQTAQALKTLTVTALDDADNGQCDTLHCSLREAIETASAAAVPSRIVFQPELFAGANQPAGMSREIVVRQSFPPIGTDLEIVGPGAGVLTLRMAKSLAAPEDQAGPPNEARPGAPFFVIERRVTEQPQVHLAGLTLRDGGGGAILSLDSEVRLEGMVFSGNQGGRGGGAILFSGGMMTVENCTFDGNQGAYGGAIWNDHGQLVVARSSFTSNRAEHVANEGGYGGAIYNNPQSESFIWQSTFNANYAAELGGVLYNNGGGTVHFRLSTLSGNYTDRSGGAIFNNGELSVEECTLTLNQARIKGGALYGVKGHITVRDSIIAGNHTTEDQFHDISGAITSDGFNLVGVVDGSPSFRESRGSANDRYGSFLSPLDAGLEPLRDNGGATLTHALRPDSPARERGKSSFATDQRGQRRPCDDPVLDNADGGDGSDIGSFERQRAAVAR